MNRSVKRAKPRLKAAKPKIKAKRPVAGVKRTKAKTRPSPKGKGPTVRSLQKAARD